MMKTIGANSGFAEESQSVFSNAPRTSTTLPTYFRARVGDGGRLVIPAELRRAMDLSIGDEVVMSFRDGALEVVPQVLMIRNIQAELAQFKGPGVDIVDAFLNERRAESQEDQAAHDDPSSSRKGTLD